jgi:hypothetical protein
MSILLWGQSSLPQYIFYAVGLREGAGILFAFEMSHTESTVEYRASIFIGKHG